MGFGPQNATWADTFKKINAGKPDKLACFYLDHLIDNSVC